MQNTSFIPQMRMGLCWNIQLWTATAKMQKLSLFCWFLHGGCCHWSGRCRENVGGGRLDPHLVWTGWIRAGIQVRDQHELRESLLLPSWTHRGRRASSCQNSQGWTARAHRIPAGIFTGLPSLEEAAIPYNITNCFLGKCESDQHFQAFLICKKLQ